MEFSQIKELISLVNSTDITDLEIEDGDFRVRIRKAGPEPKFAPREVTIQPPSRSPSPPLPAGP